jgi:hypothetical protein
MPHRNVRKPRQSGISRISGDRRPLISLSHFVAKIRQYSQGVVGGGNI